MVAVAVAIGSDRRLVLEADLDGELDEALLGSVERGLGRVREVGGRVRQALAQRGRVGELGRAG